METGRRTFAMVVKTRVWYDKNMDKIRQQMKELSKLRAMVNAVANNSTIAKLEPAPKGGFPLRDIFVDRIDIDFFFCLTTGLNLFNLKNRHKF